MCTHTLLIPGKGCDATIKDRTGAMEDKLRQKKRKGKSGEIEKENEPCTWDLTEAFPPQKENSRTAENGLRPFSFHSCQPTVGRKLIPIPIHTKGHTPQATVCFWLSLSDCNSF